MTRFFGLLGALKGDRTVVCQANFRDLNPTEF